VSVGSRSSSNRVRRLSAIGGALALLAGVDAQAQPQTREQALAQDAGEYARIYGVSNAEALRRLHAQHASITVTDRLEAQYRDRVAGVSIQHRPDFRILIYLTGDSPIPEQRIRMGSMTVPITFRTGAKASRDRVVWAITYHQAAIRAAMSAPPSMGLDPRTGELVIIAGSAITARKGGAAALDARLEKLTAVPVQIRVLDRTDVNLGLHGGSRLDGIDPSDGKRYRCTTGFAVTDGQRHGITTAAHCLDDMTYYAPDRSATPLSFVRQWGWGYHDVQIHAGTASERALIYADTPRTVERPVERQVSRASTRAGDFVCHRGESTGYSCAEVELVDFAPAGDLCGGACLPTWVTVAGPTCKGGDSGGPVFSGTTAYGIVKGASYRRDGSCAFYFYMSLDYLPAPWSLLTERALVGGSPDLPKTR
jgi:streptogrisin C